MIEENQMEPWESGAPSTKAQHIWQIIIIIIIIIALS